MAPKNDWSEDALKWRIETWTKIMQGKAERSGSTGNPCYIVNSWKSKGLWPSSKVEARATEWTTVLHKREINTVYCEQSRSEEWLRYKDTFTEGEVQK
jgi:hypothetical protein